MACQDARKKRQKVNHTALFKAGRIYEKNSSSFAYIMIRTKESKERT